MVKNMSPDNRGELTGVLWFFSAITFVGLFVSAGILGELTAAHIVFAVIILLLAVSGTIYLLRGKDTDAQQDKAKRERVDTLLHDMSDEELIELKQRLESVDTAEKPISEYLGDDGELVQRR